MQTLFQVSLLCVLTASLCVFLKSHRPEFAFVAATAGGLAAFAIIVPALRETIAVVGDIADGLPALAEQRSVLFRALAAALVAEFAAGVCRDAGENALAAKAELCARVAVASMALPLIAELARSLGAMSL